MKTYREALNKLPQPYRAVAIANTPGQLIDSPFIETGHVLAWAFSWDDSPEGRPFWAKVEAAAENGTPFPPMKVKGGRHSLKMKRQILKAGILNDLERINQSLESAAPILSSVELLSMSTAFAEFAELIMKLP